MKNSSVSLRHIIQQADIAGSKTKQLEIVVSEVCAAMNVEVCSLYIAQDDERLVLAATKGLNPTAIGSVHMKIGEGLVGITAKTCHPP